MLKTICLGVAAALGVAAEANGIFMLWSPEAWYLAVPGVTTTGPFNQHFVRDIGLIFLFVGTAFLAGAFLPGHRVILWTTPTLWLWGHASSISGKSPSASAARRFSRGIFPPSLFLPSSARF